MRRVLLGFGLILLSLNAACVTNPATGRSQFNALSTEQEIAIGTQAMPELIEGYGGVVPDPALRDYVTRIGMSMVPYTEAHFPELPWEFTFLNSSVINAFALPGGKVFVSRALVERMTSEAQLAGVLGHEIGHVTAQHVDDKLARQTGLEIGAAVIGVIAGQSQVQGAVELANLAVTGAGVYALKFDRNQESESDSLGMRYMTKAGYKPRGMLEVMEILKAAGGGGGQPEWMSTHPLPTTRIDRISNELKKKKYRETDSDPTLGTFEDRFERECLSRLRTLPPPAK